MPVRIEAQQGAINSWLSLGFDVVSVNVPGEVEYLRAEFPAVRFATIVRPESGQNERPNVAINDILPLLAAASGRICGIVNSDISFRVGNDFLAFIEENAAEGMVFGSRIDVDSDNHESGREYCLGFDYFFFDKNLIPLFPATIFSLGMPYWDYWLPMTLLLKGVRVKRLISPIAFHISHHSDWDKHLEQFGSKFLEALESLFLSNIEAELFSDRLLFSVDAGDKDNCSEIVHFILRYVVQNLSYSHNKNDEACVTINAAAFEDMKSKLLAYNDRLAESHRSLAAVYDSDSWRLTRPLRTLKSILKRLMK